MQTAVATLKVQHAGDHPGGRTAMSESKSAKQAEKTISELSGATREFARQGADFAKDVSDRTKATAEVTSKAAGEAYSTFTSGAVEFQRQWIEMVRANTNATLDFVHQVLGVKSPSAFVELSAEHARKQRGIRRTGTASHRHRAKADDRYGRADAGRHEERFQQGGLIRDVVVFGPGLSRLGEAFSRVEYLH